MKTADAAGLMATGAGHVVEPALEAGDGADVFECNAACRGFLQCRDHLALAKNLVAVAVGLYETKCGLQFRRRKSDRRRGDGAGRKKFLRNQDGAAIELDEVFRIKQPRPE